MQDFEPFLDNPATAAFIRSGQFAELCQTTKETLRHYRSIGLLEPVAVGENGYALYSPLQLSDFLLISALKNAGCSLDEIRSYLVDPAAEKLRPVVEERIAAIEEQRRTLLHQQRFLQNTLSRAQALSSWSGAEPSFRLRQCAEAWFLDTDISDLFLGPDRVAPGGELVLVQRLMAQWNLCQRRGLGGELQGCYRVGLQALLDGVPEQDFHLCMAVPGRPKGRKSARRGTARGGAASDAPSLGAVASTFSDNSLLDSAASACSDSVSPSTTTSVDTPVYSDNSPRTAVSARAGSSKRTAASASDCPAAFDGPSTRSNAPRTSSASGPAAPFYVEKPEGEYFQWLRRANIGEMLQSDALIFGAYHNFIDELRKHRLRPVGDLFEQELSLYAGNFAETNYSELSMRVERL